VSNCHEQFNAWRHREQLRTNRRCWLILLLWLGASFYALFSSRHELLIILGAYLVLLLIPFGVARILDHKRK